MSSVFDQLQQAKIFTKLDLRNAYHLIHIRGGDEWKTRIIYEYLVRPFILTNAPAVFQAMINDVLRDFHDHFVYLYLDDIMIYSPDLKTHQVHVTSFKRLYLVCYSKTRKTWFQTWFLQQSLNNSLFKMTMT